MREAHQGKPGIIRSPEGPVLGVSLGYDYCSEHEWGIDGVRAAFGVMGPKESLDVWGIQRRTVTKYPDEAIHRIRFSDTEDPEIQKLNLTGEALIFRYGFGNYPASDRYALSMLRGRPVRHEVMRKNGKPFKNPKYEYRSGPFGSAWEQGEFAFRTDDIDALNEIHEALKSLDAIIMLGGSDSNNPFGGSGILIGIKSRLPQETLDLQYEGDKEHYETQKYKEESGIEQILRDAKKGWYALSPKRFPEGLQTQRGVVVPEQGGIAFWLNPREQNKYEAGWYNLEELKMWARDEGPVMGAPQSGARS